MYYYNMCGFIFNVMCVMGGVYSKGKINKIEAELSSFIISGGPGLAQLALRPYHHCGRLVDDS